MCDFFIYTLFPFTFVSIKLCVVCIMFCMLLYWVFSPASHRGVFP